MEKRKEICSLLKSTDNVEVGSTVNIKGWVRTKRGSKNVAFLAMNDGSCLHNIQVVVDFEIIADELLLKV
ncbi:MAG: asparagine--tRNA ligase, partial [Bacteroidota bacterium]|nr:asparagine--tRNA ligase [Bacteroidota bacterium]